MTVSDSVLAVDEVARSAVRLGSRVTVARIDGALHDVLLSAPAPRREAYASIDAWMRGLPAWTRAVSAGYR